MGIVNCYMAMIVRYTAGMLRIVNCGGYYYVRDNNNNNNNNGYF